MPLFQEDSLEKILVLILYTFKYTVHALRRGGIQRECIFVCHRLPFPCFVRVDSAAGVADFNKGFSLVGGIKLNTQFFFL